MATKKTSGPTPVESVKHTDSRVNIPTEELRNFVREDEHKPKTVLYPRDPSLDPQLVWKGKDEQDSEDLAVPAVPIYIQEKIHPQVLVENLRDTAKRGEKEPELTLFDDFNGITEFDQKIDFYNHEQHWSNRMILGDSMLVMNSLAEKEGLKGKVQMIYIDPPYGIKFGSNWQVSTRKRDVKDGSAVDATRQPEQIKAFRDTWELGIHSYLAYLRDRLVVARELLTETGSVFVQIGDENVHLVRCLMDEVFGSENFIAEIAFLTTTGRGSGTLDKVYDTLLWYGKRYSDDLVKYRQLFSSVDEDDVEDKFPYVEPTGEKYSLRDSSSQGETDTGRYAYEFQDKTFTPPPGRHWSTTIGGVDRLRKSDRLYDFGRQLRVKRYHNDASASPIGNLWIDTQRGSFQESKIYVVQTNARVIERCVLMTTDPGDLVLDPTCGSGTTAYVAEQWGRRWITIDTSRVSLALARTRLMAAKYPYYTLADSPEGVTKEEEITGNLSPALSRGEREHLACDIKKGFVYKRVPHITLKSIANNEEIDTIHAKWQTQLEPLREEINQALGQTWEEWEIPRELSAETLNQVQSIMALRAAQGNENMGLLSYDRGR